MADFEDEYEGDFEDAPAQNAGFEGLISEIMSRPEKRIIPSLNDILDQ